MRLLPIAAAAWLMLSLPLAAGAQATPPDPAASAIERVEVVGTSPLAGLGVAREVLPYSSHVVQRAAIDGLQAETLTDLLLKRLPGIQVNDIQGSPFQADLTYRGHRASGLIGASQGLAVYLDGIRVNEPFGDVVSWDLVPEFALRSVTLTPGANPAFGLNTLGGALSLQTLDGRSAPGWAAELSAGSFRRVKGHVTHGAEWGDGWHSFVGLGLFDERGWRDHSPGRQALLFAKVGRERGGEAFNLSVLGGDTTLVGNGLVPWKNVDDDGQLSPQLHEVDRRAIYTHPDRTHSRLVQVALDWSRQIDADTKAQALAYVRHTRRDTLMGDVAESIDPVAPELNAAFNRTNARQTAVGLATSLARRSGAHQWQVGARLDANRVRFHQSEQEGFFDATRGVVAGDEPPELAVALGGRAWNVNLYATDTWQLAPTTHLTATLSGNLSQVRNALTTVDDDTELLTVRPTERFRYRSLNPALGLTQQLAPRWTAFANVARNTRVPTSVELGCADPAEPCRLPAGMQSDPYLAQVKSTAIETGLRWRPADGQRVEMTVHRATQRDDILFTSVSATGQLGVFTNFPRTRHQGVDLEWEGRQGAWTFVAGYSFLDATYDAAGTLRIGERNVEIERGMRMATLPRHSARVATDWRAAPGFRVGFDLQAVASRGVLGNEDGRLEDGGDPMPHLKVPGYAVVNLRTAWQVRPGVELTARLNNVFDRRTMSTGMLNEAVFDAAGSYTGQRRQALFVGPGSPRSVSVGVRVAF